MFLMGLGFRVITEAISQITELVYNSCCKPFLTLIYNNDNYPCALLLLYSLACIFYSIQASFALLEFLPLAKPSYIKTW